MRVPRAGGSHGELAHVTSLRPEAILCVGHASTCAAFTWRVPLGAYSCVTGACHCVHWPTWFSGVLMI